LNFHAVGQRVGRVDDDAVASSRFSGFEGPIRSFHEAAANAEISFGICFALKTEQESNLTSFAFRTALDPVGMQPGKVSSEPTDEALFFNHFPFGTDIRQTGQVSGVAKRNPDVECVAAKRVDKLLRTLSHATNCKSSQENPSQNFGTCPPASELILKFDNPAW
jgi:hypothetical protein